MDLPTYTNIWRIEKRLYKLYDFRLPMPLPINWIAVFAGITVPYIVLLVAIGLPFSHSLVWLYVLPPGLLTWLTTRPVIENKRLPELVESQVRYLTEPRVWCRLAPLTEKDQTVVTARVWHSRRVAQPRKTTARRDAAGAVALRARGTVARRGRDSAAAIGDPADGNAPLAAASALAAAPAAAPPRARARSRARGTGGPNGRVPSPSGRQHPDGGKTRAPRQDWAAQQLAAARQAQSPQQTWPAQRDLDEAAAPLSPAAAADSPAAAPHAPVAGQPGQAAKPGRFRLAALRPKPTGSAPALPPGLALRPPAEPGRSRRIGPADPPRGEPGQPGQAGSARSWPEGPSRRSAPGLAPWRVAARSAPPLGSVAAPVPSERPAHATPDVYPALLVPPDLPSPVIPDVSPAIPQTPSAEVYPALVVPPDIASPVIPDEPPAPDLPAHVTPDVSPAIAEVPSAEAYLAPPDPLSRVTLDVPAHVEIAHDGPVQRPLPPAQPELDDRGSKLANSAADGPRSWDGADGSAAADARPAVEAHPTVEAVPAMEALPPVPAAPAPAAAALAGTLDLAVPSIERALSGPSRDRDLSWHGKVKIVAGGGQGPGRRDQEALDRARARLPLRSPKRVLVLGCTSGAGQTVTTLMTGHILASLREEPVAAVDLHDGALARYTEPAGWLDDVLSGKPPLGAATARPDGLHPAPKTAPARLDVIAARGPLGDGDELKLAAALNRHYPLAMLDPGGADLMKLLKLADQLVIVVPASVDGAGALADTRDWLETHGFTELAGHSVTVINGVSRRSLPDVELAESVARGRCRAIVRVPWDEMLPAGVTGPSTLRSQTRVAYTALAGVLVAGLAAAPVRSTQ